MTAASNNRRVVLAGVALLTAAWLAPIVYCLAAALRTSVPSEMQVAHSAVVLTLLGALTAWRLPSNYYQLRGWETKGGLYSHVGVRRFRCYVLDGHMLGRWLRPAERAGSFPTRAQLLAWSDQRCVTERHHCAAMLMSLPSIYLAGRSGDGGMTAYLILGNIFFNAYPILLQRYTRGRLRRSIDVRGSREAVHAAKLTSAVPANSTTPDPITSSARRPSTAARSM